MSDKIASWGNIYTKLESTVDDPGSFADWALYHDLRYCPTKYEIDGAGFGIYVDTYNNYYTPYQLVRLQDVKCMGNSANPTITIAGRILFHNQYSNQGYNDCDHIEHAEAEIIYHDGEGEAYQYDTIYASISIYNPNGDFDVSFILPNNNCTLLKVYFYLYMYDGYPFNGCRYEGYANLYKDASGDFRYDFNVGSIALYES